MNYTLLILWTNLKPELYHSDNREFLERLAKDSSPNPSYIFKNTPPISRRIVECENGLITYL